MLPIDYEYEYDVGFVLVLLLVLVHGKLPVGRGLWYPGRMSVFLRVCFLSGLVAWGASCMAADEPAEKADGDAPSGRVIEVALEAPDAAWRVEIEEVVQRADGLFVVCQLSRRPGAGAQAITVVRDSVEVDAPRRQPVRVFVLGKAWNWRNKEPYLFLGDRSILQSKLDEGTRLYRRGVGDDASEGGEGASPVVTLRPCLVILRETVGKPESAEKVGRRLAEKYQGQFSRKLSGVRGFHGAFPEDRLAALRADPSVVLVDVR